MSTDTLLKASTANYMTELNKKSWHSVMGNILKNIEEQSKLGVFQYNPTEHLKYLTIYDLNKVTKELQKLGYVIIDPFNSYVIGWDKIKAIEQMTSQVENAFNDTIEKKKRYFKLVIPIDNYFTQETFQTLEVLTNHRIESTQFRCFCKNYSLYGFKIGAEGKALTIKGKITY